ncbi:arsenic transporter [Glacieibacterium frigidum]|uniref:arsenic transporter n=1 Tax=Glacieibacterium frigidum TaxID=2593303 RepID=UPI001F25696E|nr:arsenic transporter [Glacieibacterium frigidum]
MPPTPSDIATWAIVLAAVACIVAQPFRLPEAVWAVAGAVLLLAGGLLPWQAALQAVAGGLDVYLFLIGMMLLSEVARREGVFDWLAGHAVDRAAGSPRRLFALVYAIGVVVTTFMSNDATAVVLTPAVIAATRAARVDPLPHLFACAMVANAASFVLPISNPANLVMHGAAMPPLGEWLARFALPSIASIGVTFAVLRWTQARRLGGACAARSEPSLLSPSGRTALAGIGVAAAGLLIASALDTPLGLPTFALGVLTVAAVVALRRAALMPVLAGVSWSVVPLVGGLFVLVAGVAQGGGTAWLADALRRGLEVSADQTAAVAGVVVAFASNLVNNLPAGLIASTAVAEAQAPARVVDALLIGVDLGPNLSVTGSLATILWLTALRREGLDVGFWQFLKVGALVMPPALLAALAARLLF